MATVGEAVIKLRFDSKGLDKNIAGDAKRAGSSFANTFSVAAGNLIASGMSKIGSIVSSSIDGAIKRVDTLANANRTFANMGIDANKAKKAMSALEKGIEGLPTALDSAVQGMTSLTATYGGNIDLGQKMFKALNDGILGFGGSADMVNNAIMQISQLPLDGPLDAQTWNSLRNSGLTPVLTAMSKEFGMSVSDMKVAFGEGELKVQDFVNKLIEMDTKGGGGLKSLEKIAQDSTAGIGTSMTNAMTGITKAVGEVIKELNKNGEITSFFNSVKDGAKQAGQVVVQVIQWVKQNWSWISVILKTLLGAGGILGLISMVGKMKGAVLALNAAFKANPIMMIISIAIPLLMQLWDWINKLVEKVGGWGAVFQAVGAIFSAIYNAIFKPSIDFLIALFNKLGQVFGTVGNFFNAVFTGAINGVKTKFQNAVNFIKGLWNGIKAVFSAVGNFFKSVFTGAVNGVKNIFTGLKNTISNIFSTIGAIVKAPINGLISGINKVIDMINGIKVPDWVPLIGGKSANIPKIGYLAQGGYARGASLNYIGEAGSEVALPLQRNTDNWSGLLASTLADEFKSRELDAGGGNTVYMTVQVNNEMDAQDIGRVLSRSIRRMA